MSVKIPDEFYERAEANSVSRTTLYNRVERGWDIERAIATPPDHKKESLRKKSKFYGAKRGKARIVKVPIEYEEKLNKAIAQSGLTEMDFLTEVIVDYLTRSPHQDRVSNQ